MQHDFVGRLTDWEPSVGAEEAGAGGGAARPEGKASAEKAKADTQRRAREMAEAMIAQAADDE